MHPSPRWRVSLKVYQKIGAAPRFDKQYEVNAQKAETALARSVRSWQDTNRTRITRNTVILLRAWKVSAGRRS